MNSFVSPPLLQPGDRVAIVAPGRKLKQEIVDNAAQILRAWGLEVLYATNLLNETHSYLSGTDAERLDDLQYVLDSKDIKCVVCARGGYGSTRIVDSLKLDAFTKSPKWLVGFSDITALHLRLLRAGVQSIHGTMPVLFSRPDSISSVDSLRKLLFEGRCEIHASHSNDNHVGHSRGVVVGGNISLLVESLGTDTELDTTDRILFIEEVDEYAYRLDRMVNQLKRAGKFDNVRGLIIGHMTDIKSGDVPFGESVVNIIQRAIGEANYPVCYNFPSGHENPNLAWVQGGQADLHVSTSGSALVFTPFTENI